MREVCFILTRDVRILRIYTGNASHIADSKARWKAIWTYRYEIGEIVHTHPGGFLGFSREDLSTMEAVESATGCEYAWSIVTNDGYLSRRGLDGSDISITDEGNIWWLPYLRDLSFHTRPQHPKNTTTNPTHIKKLLVSK